MAWLKGLFDLLSGKAWSILLAVGGFLAALLYARQAGKDSVLKKQAEQSAKAAKRANEIREDVRRSSDTDLDARLRPYTRK
jgi:uncharacterized membrane protein YdjX (TVP38/TMEM64 family)